ncbi:MAG: twitching motility protein PilT [Lachnospiraceae bacterium]|nr:twitching motility protein PilT [Lachnospiraceae bacterium]
MVQLIVGQKGKGKTTAILAKANEEIKAASGSIVFIDKDSQHMYELNNKIRLIDISRYGVSNADEFIGFISGIISQDHDLQTMYLDGFMKCAKLEGKPVVDTIQKLDRISTASNINFVISLSLDKNEVPEEIQDKILISL